MNLAATILRPGQSIDTVRTYLEDALARVVLDADGRPVSPQHDREAWKTVRGPMLGSSDVAPILGKDEYRGAWDVWDRIILGDWDDLGHADIRRGNRQEGNALDRFSEVYGLQVFPLPMLRHPDVPHVVTDVDGLIPWPDAWPDVVQDSALWEHVLTLSGPGVAEVKVPRVPRFYRFRDEGLPTGYVIQMQHHLAVADVEWGAFIIYTPEYDDVLVFPVARDRDWGGLCLGAMHTWWLDHIVAGARPTRPAPQPGRWPSKIPGDALYREDDDWMEWSALTALRWHELVEAKAAYAQTETALLALLTDGDGPLVAGGGVTVKRRSTTSQRRKDYKALRAAVKTAQMDGDADTLLALDPDDDAFTYQTQPKDKVEVVVTAPNPME